MKIVMSWWTKPVPYGEITVATLERISLACLLARSHYSQVELVTDRLGRDFLVDRLCLPFSRVSTALDDLDSWNPAFWVSGKLLAYSLQTEPFVHIDDDVFLWERLPQRIEEAQVCVQNDERIHQYRGWLQKFRPSELRGRVLPVRTFVAHNMGIFGGRDVTFIRGYAQRALAWIESMQERFGPCHAPNMVVEQAMLAFWARRVGEPVERLFGAAPGGVETSTQEHSGYTHLTCTKHWPAVRRRIRRELRKFTGSWVGAIRPPGEAHPRRLQLRHNGVVHHSGDLGDIVFALAVLPKMYFNPVTLALSPEQRLCRPTAARERMTPEKVKFLRPLLEVQPSIKRVVYTPRMPRVCLDLNQWREEFYHSRLPEKDAVSLCEWYFKHFLPGMSAPQTEPWLTVPPRSDVPADKPITIHRSARYHNVFFPWPYLLRKYADRMQFIGLMEEWQEFMRVFGVPVRYVPVQDALQLAQVISAAKLFVGNQSFPCAIAEGLKKPLVQESCPECPTSVFDRPNALYTAEGLVPADRIVQFIDSVLR